jgi:ABC-type microcin C transport system duplicated ATPase subunit YejF
MADSIIVLRNGKIIEQGNALKIIENPESEYAQFLVSCMYD